MNHKGLLFCLLAAAGFFAFPSSGFSETTLSAVKPDTMNSSVKPGVKVASVDTLAAAVVTDSLARAGERYMPQTIDVLGSASLSMNHDLSVLPRLMQEVPGLMLTSRGMLGYGISDGGSGNISIRGLSSGASRVLVLIDGHPGYSGVYGHAFADSYQNLLAERVEVSSGPSSLLYGSNAMGGTVNIVTKKKLSNGNDFDLVLGSGSYGTFTAEASDQYRRGKFWTNVAGQYARTDNHRPHMAYQQYGGTFSAGYDFSSHWKADGNFNLTHFISRYPGSVQEPVYHAAQWISRGSGAATLSNLYKKTRGNLSVYTDFGRHKIDDGTSSPHTRTDRYFRSIDNITGLGAWQEINWVKGGYITLGFDFQHIYGHAYYTSKESGETLPVQYKNAGASHRNDVAGYLDLRQSLLSWLDVFGGVRFDTYTMCGLGKSHSEWIPQGGLQIRPWNAGTLKLMAGKGFRNPNMRELFLYPSSSQELKPERIWNYEASWKGGAFAGRLSYGLALYYLKGDNMIQTINRQNVNTGVIENSGVELKAAYRVNDKFELTTNHGFLNMAHHVVAAPEYKGYAGARFHSGKWSVNAGLTYVDGLYKSIGAAEAQETFCLLDAGLNYALCDNLTLWLIANNLLAQKYEINLGYPMPRATFMAGLKLSL